MRSLSRLPRGVGAWRSLQTPAFQASFTTTSRLAVFQTRRPLADDDNDTMLLPSENPPSVLQRLKHAKDDVKMAEREQLKKEQQRLEKSSGRARGEEAHLPPSLGEHTYAKSEDEIEQSGADYRPAKKARMPAVGGLDDWWKSTNRWYGMETPESKRCNFFPPKSTVKLPSVLTVTLRRTLVEALALRAQSPEANWAVMAWTVCHTPEVLDQVLRTGITLTRDGEPRLTGSIPDMRSLLTSGGYAKGKPTITKKKARMIMRKYNRGWGTQWLEISLRTDMHLKFAIRKRLYQLTGTLVADNDMYQMGTVGDILKHITKPDPAKTVAKALRREQRKYIMEKKQLYTKKNNRDDEDGADEGLQTLQDDEDTWQDDDDVDEDEYEDEDENEDEDGDQNEVGGTTQSYEGETMAKMSSNTHPDSGGDKTPHPRLEKPLRSLPNVKVHFRPVTRADRDRAVGRLKLIKRELRQRNLPLTPRQLRRVPRGDEAAWVMGD